MSNTPTASGKVTLDKERTLLMDFEALEIAEELTGVNMMTADLSTLSAKQVVSLVYACLKHEDPDLTRQQVAKMLTPATFLEVHVALLQIWQVAVPPQAQEILAAISRGLAQSGIPIPEKEGEQIPVTAETPSP